MTDYEAIGGEAALRAVVTEFIERVFGDVIIGFFFEKIDKRHLIEREMEHAAAHLGGPKRYKGRPIAQAHAPHPINRGHFRRRLWLLESVLAEHEIDAGVAERWLAHDRRLEDVVTTGKDCRE